MVIVTVNDKQYYMDGIFKDNLDTAKRMIRKDMDCMGLVDGPERSGKSVKAMQAAYYCDPTLDLSRVCFTAKEFQKAVINAKQYQAVIYDEAYTGLSSKATMSLINRTLIGIMAEMGQKNLFVFIVMPTFFDLDKYPALWRSKFLIHVYTRMNKETKEIQRGQFAFYNQDYKKLLYILGKKFYDYSKPHLPSTSYGRFTNYYVLNETEYRAKKLAALKSRETEREETDKAQLDQEVFNSMLFDRLLKADYLTNVEKSKLLDISEPTFYKYLRNNKFGSPNI